MPDQLQLRGGTTAEHSTFTGASKEVTVDTTKKTAVVHDGTTAGGLPLMRENGSNSALALGSVGTPSLKWDANTGIYSPGEDQLAISTGGTSRLSIDASGNLAVDTNVLYVDAVNNRAGIGTTSPKSLLTVNGNIVGLSETTHSLQHYQQASTSFTVTSIDSAISGATGSLVFKTSANWTTTNAVPAVTIDGSGRLLVGTSTSANDNVAGTGYANIVQILGAATGAGLKVGNTADFARINLVRSANVGTDVELGTLSFGTEASSVERARVSCFSETTGGSGGRGGRLMFFTAPDGDATPTEKMRITNSGQISAFSQDIGLILASNYAASSSNSLLMGRNSATAVNGGTDCISIRSNGNIQNTNNSYGAISDVKLKENIVDATSQWDDLKALQVRKYNFKEGQTHTQIGLVAQEVELVSPGLVSESPDRDAEGNDLGTVTKGVNYSVLYMKAVKALQETMERIEALEADVAALKGA